MTTTCGHWNLIEITTLGSEHHRYRCQKCGREFDGLRIAPDVAEAIRATLDSNPNGA